MVVMKFGGTSVSSLENVKQIKSILEQQDGNYIVVVSAFSGITNILENISNTAIDGDVSTALEDFRKIHFLMVRTLIGVSNQTDLILKVQNSCNVLEAICNSVFLLKELSRKTQALILSFGEQLSSLILHKYLTDNQIEITHLNSQKLIIANTDYLNGEVDFNQTNANITKAVGASNYITAGFIASNSNGDAVTLGRGGSDYSASIYAAAVNAKALEIWSDVNGIHSANPKLVKDTKTISTLSYEEAFELAYFGAKVLYPPTVIPLRSKGIPLYLKNTLYPLEKGTLISGGKTKQKDSIRGLSSLSNIALLTISGIGLARQIGKARQVFQALEGKNVNIILITQSSSEQNICIGINQADLNTAELELNKTFENEINKGVINALEITKNQSIIALVGDNMKHKIGLSGKVFETIGENGININAIAQGASERNISIVIDQKDESKALNAIHEKFFSNTIKNVHLFIAGIGNVGAEFINIINEQHQKLIDEERINFKIIGVANSKRFLIDNNGGLKEIDSLTINNNGQPYTDFSDYVMAIKKLNLRNSIFIDNTASEIVSGHYKEFFKQSISVVTCNKIASSSNYKNYSKLLALSKQHNCHFKYETSVGAALPIIKTIYDLNVSGDKIKKIEAVLSGSLNFIFNEYNGNISFSDIVKRAKKEGFTEPDPLIDLSGLDVMRKILILSREAGYVNELSDIVFDSFLPQESSNSNSEDELYSSLEKHEAHFKTLYQKAFKQGNKLKVLATMEQDKMKVELREVEPGSPYFNLQGSDNVFAIYSNRYANEPLIIKGAGAGAGITASGVFADLMYITNR